MDEQNINEAVEEKTEDFPTEKTPESKPKFIKVLIWVIVALLVIWLVALIATKKDPVELPNEYEIEDEGEIEEGEVEEEQEVEDEIVVEVEDEEEQE